jgi:phosphate acetyltransferase
LPDNINVKTYIIDELDLSKYSNFLYELRKEKGLSLSEAQELVKQPNYLASILVALGEVDGEVCGIEYKTKDTYSPALKIIKGKDGKIVSSCIILNKNDQTLVFGDISLNLNPDSTQLVDIATEICLFSKNVIGLKNTNVAMLSYSTNKSGAGESVDKVVQASEKLKQINDLKEFNFSNDIQFDAAIDGAVRSKKASNLS